WRTSEHGEAGSSDGSHCVTQVDTPAVREAAETADESRGGLRPRTSRGLRKYDDRVQDERRSQGHRRSDDLLEFRGCRPATLRRVVRSRVFAEVEFARQRFAAVLQPGGEGQSW